MAQQDLLKLQLQARENAVELNDYLKDLNSWQSEIKEKDKTFREMKPSSQGKMVPPVRSGIKPEELEKKKKEPAKRIRSYDFKAWDNLDVDQLIEDIDEEDERKKMVKHEKEAEKLEKDLIALSLDEKEKGNNFFKNGKYEKALECYTKGMQYDPSNAVFPANRAMTYLKMDKWVETEADCTLSLSLDSGYVKSYLRRATARMKMGKVGSAEKDFNDVLKLEPDNKQAAKELKKIASMGRKDVVKSSGGDETKKPSFASRWKKSQRINAVIRPYNRRSKKPLRRIPVQEIGAMIELTTTTKEDRFESGDRETRVDKKKKKVMIEEMEAAPTTSTSAACSKEEEKKRVVKQVEVVATNTSSKPPTSQTIPPPPKLSAKFRSDVEMLKKRGGDDVFAYLLQISPSSLPNLIKNDLDADIFESIVSALCTRVQHHGDFVRDFLQNISKLKRFKSALLCIDETTETDLRSIFVKLLASCKEDEKNELENLRKTYKC